MSTTAPAPAPAPAPATNNAIVTTKPERITTSVEKEITTLVNDGRLALPSDYAVGNALSAAWLKLQTVQNLEKKNVIVNGQIDKSVVTETSVANALRAYAIQGLNVDKDQAYFIVYGKELTLQRSYHGDMLLSMRVAPGIEFYSGVIYDGDEVQVEIARGRTYVASHKTKFGNADAGIKGAYCGVLSPDGEDLGVVIMTMKEIEQSWKQSKTYKADGQGTHQRFTSEMALRTVKRKRCKSIIKTSSDKVLLETIKQTEIEAIGAEMDDIVEVEANGQVLSLPAQEAEQPKEETQTGGEQGSLGGPGF